MSINRTQNDVTIEADVLSASLREALTHGFLPEGLVEDVTDQFPHGDQMTIPTVGEPVVRDANAAAPNHQDDDLSMGSASITISDFKSSTVSILDTWREDSGPQREAALLGKIDGHIRKALKGAYESDMLTAINDIQTADNANAFDGIDHRILATGANNTFDFADVASANRALTEAGVTGRRVAIVPPIVAQTLDVLAGAEGFTNNPELDGIIGTGMAQGIRFVRNIGGIDFLVANRMPVLSAELSSGEEVQPCFFFSVQEDERPLMQAWRRMPRVKGDRKEDLEKDIFYGTARYGFGTYRKESLYTVLVSSTNVS